MTNRRMTRIDNHDDSLGESNTSSSLTVLEVGSFRKNKRGIATLPRSCLTADAFDQLTRTVTIETLQQVENFKKS